MITETVNADKETSRKILHDELNIKKICAKLVSKNLTSDHSSSINRSVQIFLRGEMKSRHLWKTSSLAMKPEYSNTMLKLKPAVHYA